MGRTKSDELNYFQLLLLQVIHKLAKGKNHCILRSSDYLVIDSQLIHYYLKQLIDLDYITILKHKAGHDSWRLIKIHVDKEINASAEKKIFLSGCHTHLKKLKKKALQNRINQLTFRK